MLRQCRISVKDMNDVEHVVTVSASSLFEAVALGLAQIKKSEWVADIATGLNVVTVELPEASVKHQVVMKHFEKMAGQAGKVAARDDGEAEDSGNFGPSEIICGPHPVRWVGTTS